MHLCLNYACITDFDMKVHCTKILVCLTLLLACQGVHAISPRFDVCVEWGYTQSFFGAYKYNILSSEGGRIFDNESGVLFRSNADLLAGISIKLGRRHAISALGGYSGVPSRSRVMPVKIRYRYFYKDFINDGLFSFAEGGIGFKLENDLDVLPAYMGGLGAGYRIKLSPGANLDFLLAVKCILDKPKIPDPEGQGYVKAENILSNIASYYGLNLSLAISF